MHRTVGSKGILKHHQLRENDDYERWHQHESKKQYGVDPPRVTNGVRKEIVRKRSSETESTSNSSEMYSLDLLMEIYPSLSEYESDSEGSQSGDSNGDTVVYTNPSKKNLTTDSENKDIVSEDLSNFTSKSDTISDWVDDKPFDEESLMAMSEVLSEQGDRIKNVYSKEFDPSEEHTLSPEYLPPKLIRKSTIQKPYDVVKKSSMDTASTAPIVHKLPSRYDNNEEGLSSKSTKQKNSTECNLVVTKKLCLIALIFTTILLAGAIFAYFVVSYGNEKDAPQNQAAAASSNLIESIGLDVEDPIGGSNEGVSNFPRDDLANIQTMVPSTASGPWTGTIEQLPTPTDERPWGTIITYLDPIPEQFFPLGLCAGDCDRDDDCAEGLVCFHRGANDPIPFCFGGENDYTRTDYCTYPSFDSEIFPEEVADEECVTNVSVVQDCFFRTENVVVVKLQNCNPKDEDWIGVYPDGTIFDDGSPSIEWASDDYIDWAYTCGDTSCVDSPLMYSFAFPTYDYSAFGYPSLRVYLLRNTENGPPYEVVAKSESFVPTQACQ